MGRLDEHDLELEDQLSPFAPNAEAETGSSRFDSPGWGASPFAASEDETPPGLFPPAELEQSGPLELREDDTEAETWGDAPTSGEAAWDRAEATEPELEWDTGPAEPEEEYDQDREGEMDGWGQELGLAEADNWSELELPDEVFSQEDAEETEAEYEEETPGGLAPGLSPLARRGQMHPGHGDRKGVWRDQVYGLVVHTTGGTLPGKARKAGMLAADYAVRYYAKSGGAHYVNGWGGVDGQQLHQVMNERKVAWGVGVSKDQPKKNQWRSVDAGRFEADLPATVVRLWRARWPGLKDSLQLLPVRSSANLTYVHVECTPCLYYQSGTGRLITDPEYAPMRPGLRFTRAQHETIARLAWDIGQRHGWPAGQAWWRTPRLLGHEDITPLSRHDNNGGWDPGGLRDQPYFDWPFVYQQLERLSGGTGAAPAAGGGGIISSVTATVGSLLGGLADRFRGLVQAGNETAAVTEAIRAGQTDASKLANLVFFARHPERNARPIGRDERQLASEWLQIRDTIVRPALARIGSGPGSTTGASPAAPAAPAAGSGPATGDIPTGPFGRLTIKAPERYRFSYQLTGDDAAWVARLITGESGGRNDQDSAAVIWAVLNRFALFTHRGSYWMTKAGYKGYATLADFVQAYSTTLQPVLKSVGAAKRAIELARKNPAKFQYVRTGGVYSGTSIPRGQLKHHLDRIQQLRWSRLPQGTRDIVLAAFSGRLQSPVGLASEFANTATYFRDAHKRRPSEAEWRQFTLAHARKKNWTWVDTPSLKQYQSNVFFVDNRAKDLPPDTVKIVV